MLWILPVTLAVAGLVGLAVLANRVRREIEPTAIAIDRFGREHRVALGEARGRLQAETSATRRRLSRDVPPAH